MKAALLSPLSAAAILIAAAVPVGSFAQSSTTTTGGATAASGTAGTPTGAGAAGSGTGASAAANPGVSNPLIGGTGTYGSAAQGSTTGGGAYSVPLGNIAAIDETFRRLDRNGDGVVSQEEFRAGYATRFVGSGSGAAPANGGATKKARSR